MKVLWFGNPYESKVFSRNQAVSAASSLWQESFLKELIHQGCEIKSIGHMPSSSFPKGKLINKKKLYHNGFFSHCDISYLNVYKIRNKHASLNYLIEIKEIMESFKPDLVMSYNINFEHIKGIDYVRSATKVKWVAFISDMKDLPLQTKFYKSTFDKPDYHVFFSHYSYITSEVECKYNYFGGCEVSTISNQNQINKTLIEKPYIMYCGTVDESRDIELMIKSFSSFDRNIKLLITGKNRGMQLENNSNVEFLGFLPPDMLDELCKNAICFLNPRSQKNKDNLHNFPSKILFYLKYRKPIISSKQVSIPKYFDSVIDYVDDDVASWSDKISNVIKLDESEIYIKQNKIDNFIKKHSWRNNTRKLMLWVQKGIER